MSNLTQDGNKKNVVFEQGSTIDKNTVFVKLVPLNEEQKEKGFYQQLEEGQSLEGILESIGTNKYGKQEYTLAELNGPKKLVIASAGNLGFRMKDKGINIGDAVQITYNGKNVATSGKYAGTAMHSFTVLGEA